MVDWNNTTPKTPTIPAIPSYGDDAVVFQAARAATRILEAQGYTFAIFGSLACYLYGSRRVPNDVDIVISSYTCDPEEIKVLLVAANPALFYLVRSKSPQSPWNVLWYCDIDDREMKKVKVDILRAGTLQLPKIFSETIVEKQGLPVVPMSVLLLHKLKGWKDNMDSTEWRHQRKYSSDASDVHSLLGIIINGMSKQERENSKDWKSFAPERFDDAFKDDTEHRISIFCSRFPECRNLWSFLGW
ncbi:hypothetical protein ARMSODRAFT_892314 [Armillaria solidipes]|uniref:Nucleotidyltransferase n=1 Tax=Armillaria solidipes TaxID=1076256 RepID=A0A2H3BK80_9AGAR|nr:hypothetical protein ARMSODRAFT_892314 [Armillaria solidipes]